MLFIELCDTGVPTRYLTYKNKFQKELNDNSNETLSCSMLGAQANQ